MNSDRIPVHRFMLDTPEICRRSPPPILDLTMHVFPVYLDWVLDREPMMSAEDYIFTCESYQRLEGEYLSSQLEEVVDILECIFDSLPELVELVNNYEYNDCALHISTMVSYVELVLNEE